MQTTYYLFFNRVKFANIKYNNIIKYQLINLMDTKGNQLIFIFYCDINFISKSKVSQGFTAAAFTFY